MRIVNVIRIRANQVENIESFGIHDEQLSNEVVQRAEKEFVNQIKDLGYDSDDEIAIDNFIEEGHYEKDNVAINLVWSYD